jgi:hypothetical protein
VFENDVLTVTGYLASHRVSAKGLIGKTMTVSCESTRSGSKGGGIAIEFKDSSNVKISGLYKQNELSQTLTFTVPENTDVIVFFFYGSGNQDEVGTGVYRKVQLELGSSVSDYESCATKSYTVPTDGLVNADSISPNMTIFASRAGVVVEAEYNVDNNEILGDIHSALGTILDIQNSLIGGDV